jgi:tyrosine aminotransferase
MINMKSKLKECSNHAFSRLSGIRGIQPIQAKAAMYMMVRINIEDFEDIADDVDFCKKLLNEQFCLVFPAQCFFYKDAFRIVSYLSIDA